MPPIAVKPRVTKRIYSPPGRDGAIVSADGQWIAALNANLQSCVAWDGYEMAAFVYLEAL